MSHQNPISKNHNMVQHSIEIWQNSIITSTKSEDHTYGII